MRLRTLVLGIAASLWLAPAALAADLGGAPARRGSIKDAPADVALAPAPLYSWSGLYIGGHVGYGWTDIDWTEAATTINDSGTGWFGGGQAGLNWQRGALVFGVEADISGTGIEGSAACPNPAADCSHQINWLASVRGRLGVAGNNNRTLFYATAGGPGPISTMPPRAGPASPTPSSAGWAAAASSTC